MPDRMVAGIDEAGRGPLVGCMFQACVVVRESTLKKLRSIGVRDSKSISRLRRAALIGAVLSSAEVVLVRSYPPQVIDKENINTLLARGLVELVRTAIALVGRKNLVKVYADEISGRNAREILERGLSVPLVIEAGADRKYVVVSAASIVAKYFRDTHVRRISSVWGDLGSGYPSDPRTRRWVLSYYKELGDLPPIVRSSWRTLAKLGIGPRKGGLEKWIRREGRLT